MFVSRVTPVNSNMLGAMPSSVNKHESVNVSNPSFCALYKPLTAKLILKYVPQHEMERYSGMMMSAALSAGEDNKKGKFYTDTVITLVVKRALAIRKAVREQKKIAEILAQGIPNQTAA